MWLILGFLSLLPLLSLVPLHWYRVTGQHGCATKAARLAFSGSLFWGLSAAYLHAGHPAWRWAPFLLLTAGAGLFEACLRPEGPRPWLRRGLALAAFCGIFQLCGRLAPDWDLAKPLDRGAVVSAVAQFQGWH